MSVIIRNNNTLTLGEITASYDRLPVGNYSLQFDERTGFFLKVQDDFKLPTKLYGNFDFINRWIKSYAHNSEKNMGILLSGVKGTGKTIAAQLFCVKSQFPVIFITEHFHGPDFEAFLSNPVFSNTIIFIDEFEKVYQHEEHSQSVLTLMDGMYHTKLIFLLTANNPANINNKLQNRLNRIKYHKLYVKLAPEIIKEIIDDLLVHKHRRASMEDFVDKFDMITMDVLTSVIKEVNLFDEDAIVCASHLNLTEEVEYYSAAVIHKEVVHKYDGRSFNYKRQPFVVSYYNGSDEDVDPELKALLPEYSEIELWKYHYVVTDAQIIFDIDEDTKIVLKRSQYSLAF